MSVIEAMQEIRVCEKHFEMDPYEYEHLAPRRRILVDSAILIWVAPEATPEDDSLARVNYFRSLNL